MTGKNLQYRSYYKRNLPHYQPKEGIFFLTYRLAFSLPKEILNELENRKNEINDKLKRLTEKDKRIQETKYNKILFDTLKIASWINMRKGRSGSKILKLLT